MKIIIGICLLLIAASTAWADCPSDFSLNECQKYTAIEQAFVHASEDATKALINGIVSASSRRAQLYEAALALFREQVALAIKAGRLTKELAASLLEDLQTQYEKAKEATSSIAGDALDAIAAAQKKIADSLKEITDAIVKDFPARKEQLKELLANARQQLQGIVETAVGKANSGLEKVQGFFQRLLEKVTGSKVLQSWKQKLEDLFKKLTNKVSAEITDGIEPAVEAVVFSTEEALYGLQLDDEMNKRDITSTWTRVKDAVKKLSGKVYKQALEILESKKPQIMAELKKIGKAATDITERIVTQLANQIIKNYLS